MPKLKEDSFTKKSNFVYNYCLEENMDVCRPGNKVKELHRRVSGKYLKLGMNEDAYVRGLEKFNNVKLMEELKQYRLQKIK